MTNSKLGLEEIWRLGCNGESLTPGDQKRFAAMARSRFHTFEMGIDHAIRQADEDKQLDLIRGLVVELMAAPGLKKLWLRMEISSSGVGEQVSLQLEKMDSTTH